MKITLSTSSRRKQNGSAVLIVLILLGILLMFIAGNTRTLNQLKREINLIEQKQLKRQAASAIPGAPPQSDSTEP